MPLLPKRPLADPNFAATLANPQGAGMPTSPEQLAGPGGMLDQSGLPDYKALGRASLMQLMLKRKRAAQGADNQVRSTTPSAQSSVNKGDLSQFSNPFMGGLNSQLFQGLGMFNR